MSRALQRPRLKPHAGQQSKWLASPADIAIYGGAAGGGKSYALLLEPLRHIAKQGFGAVAFRRTYPEITNEGGLWDSSVKVYGQLGLTMKEGALEWQAPNGNTISFRHLQHEKDKLSWQGSAIPLILFDELTHFTRGMFFYLLSRNRLTHDCGVRPYIRATCNPDAASWVADFISWWIDQDTGLPIAARDGQLRWFVIRDDKLVWADTREELIDPARPEIEPKSVTFVAARVTDNPTLMRQDPGYLANLHALPRFERMQLLEGNWKVRPTAGMFFQRAWFPIVDAAPAQGKTVRYWDRAATEPTPRTDPDWTVGLKMRAGPDGRWYVLDVQRFRARPHAVTAAIRNCAEQDGQQCQVWLEQDPGQAGVSEIGALVRALAGFPCFANRVTTSKITRALPASAQAEAGNIVLVRATWNEALLAELEAFADEDQLPAELRSKGANHDDQVDAFSGAFNVLAQSPAPRIY